MDQDRPGFAPPPAGSTPGDASLAPTANGGTEVISSSQRGRRIGTGVLVAAVGIAALGVAGATYAAASDPSPSTSTGSSSEGPQQVPGVGGDKDGDGNHRGFGQGGPGRGGHGPGFGFGGLGRAVHGTAVVPNKDGTGFQTVQMQHGTVTAVSASSISVKSEDGFTATYVVNADTKVNRNGAIADIKVDADVVVTGVVDGSTVTARSVGDTAAFGKRGDRDGHGPGGMKSGEPSPSASA